MAREITYGAQVFALDRRKQLRFEGTREAKTAAFAQAMARRLVEMRQAAGAIAFSRDCDPEMGDYEEPKILGVFGDVPPAALEG
jgi:hypothetical protein